MTGRLKLSCANRTKGVIAHSLLLSLLMTGTLVISGCATSQPAPKVQEAGQTAQDSPQQNVEMIRALSQINDLKEELKLLRNAVEEMQFKQDNAERRQQDLLQDIDRRLLALEDAGKTRGALIQQSSTIPQSGQILEQGQIGSGGIGSGDVSSRATEGISDQSQQSDVATTATGDQAPAQVDSVTVNSAVAGASVIGSEDSGSTSVSMTEQQAYESAFEMLKQSRYQDAIEQFQALVNTWPESQLADDALYWMAEANYVNREFEAALNGFRSVVERYPDSSRLPEAMLKVGYIQYDIGAYDQAAQTFQDILARFPGHQVTVAAETRLRRIQQTIQ